ncbi:hypothetical protein CONCODRAFT_8881 [Conidiobolus coronatus NRRL 28638]|uniref:Nudix hydrolase domain-containing protein n=1 Tax=Conidiobolus coronatus (strain ATCC 28846 / CBS 209.66 / NRRL 28638) TaxID=796925 RepID=A0A137P139_CONC2|nr:hypothetical protein CONCODRAFT_8881 [Conidiobolus coronatus NRRL 28638]|eukprot:KXN68775.1 hypothetical protein CONCODRAFT_8881 [Conidiobolus coronatus NRRL 28638]
MGESKEHKVRKVVGVIPFNPETKQILIVSSRKHPDEWVIPKGGWEDNESPEEGAAREAWEEAGIRGEVGEKIGEWPHEKLNKHGVPKHHFTFFTMKVTEVLDKWPEDGFRTRKWVSFEEASELVRWSFMKKAITQFTKVE